MSLYLTLYFFLRFAYFSSYLLYFFFFFFKQKTAYEMRISDWSSDVCSSDLHAVGVGHEPDRHRLVHGVDAPDGPTATGAEQEPLRLEAGTDPGGEVDPRLDGLSGPLVGHPALEAEPGGAPRLAPPATVLEGNGRAHV